MPEITEAKLYEAFGITPPADDAGEGAQVQETAAPAAEGTPASADGGVQVQDPADPAKAETEQEPAGHSESPAGSADSDDADAGQNRSKEPLTPEQRRENAARRRQQEQQEAIEKAVNNALQAEQEKNAKAMEAFFQRMGAKNTYTNQPITTMDEFYEWKNQYDAEQLNKDLKAGKATAEQLSQLIANHPAVRQAQQVTEQAKQVQEQQRRAADQTRIDTEMEEIAKLNPDIRSVSDLLTMPKSDAFKGYVAKGYGFLDAYKLTHMEEITNAKAEAARQQAMNNARGKEHLTAIGSSRGNGAVAVPPSDMAMFRAFNPKATDAQIQAYYNKYKKS